MAVFRQTTVLIPRKSASFAIHRMAATTRHQFLSGTGS
jgi:hypothetical protein